MNAKQKKTWESIFRDPIKPVRWANVVSLIKTLGGKVLKGSGSKRSLLLGENEMFIHEPHPGNELKRYQIKQLREFLS